MARRKHCVASVISHALRATPPSPAVVLVTKREQRCVRPGADTFTTYTPTFYFGARLLWTSACRPSLRSRPARRCPHRNIWRRPPRCWAALSVPARSATANRSARQSSVLPAGAGIFRPAASYRRKTARSSMPVPATAGNRDCLPRARTEQSPAQRRVEDPRTERLIEVAARGDFAAFNADPRS